MQRLLNAVGFSAPAYLVTETGGSAVVTINRSGSTAGTVTVDYATVDGSALAGNNYTAESGTLTFDAGQASQTVTIPIQDDGIATPDLSFQIVLDNPSGTSLGSVTDAVVTIADAESAGVLSFSTAGETTLESQEPAPLVVTRTGSSLGEVTVDYRVTGGTAVPQESAGDQGNNFNYFDTYGTLTFQAGQTTATIPITTIDIYQSAILPNAPVFGDPLTIDVTLGDPTGGAILGAITTSVITIVGPDDANGGFGVEELNSNADGGGVQMEVFRTGSVAGLESVQYATSDGTGTAGVNYAATSGTLTFEPGDDEKFITISVGASVLSDGSQPTFNFAISNPTGGAVLDPGEDQVTVTIASAGAFSASGFAFQNDPEALVLVQRTGGAAVGATVNYSLSDGSAKAGVDYTPVSGTLTFLAGVTQQFFDVPLLPDAQATGDISFFVNLSNPLGGATLADATGTVTIYAYPGQFHFTADSYTVAKNDASLTVTVKFDPLPGDYPIGGTSGANNNPTVTVDYATSDGTAQAGLNYGAVSGTINLGEAGTQTLTIPILDDAAVKDDQSFVLTLSDPTGGASLADGATATVTILANPTTIPPVTPPPVITGAPDRRPDAAGWYNAPVTVTFLATDQSGVASVTGPVTLSGQGANQSVTGTAVDVAGNIASTTVSGINIDLIRPVTTATVAATGSSAPDGHTVTLTAVDNLSGVAQTFYEVDGGKPQTYSGPFALGADADHTLTFWSVDKAGNVEEAQSISVPKSGTGGNSGAGGNSGTGGTGVSGGTSPPPVSSPPIVMSLKRYGVHMHPTVLVLRFSEAIDPTRADDVKNFKVLGPAGRRVSIGSAVYDPADDSVTLKPRERISIHRTYRLEVNGTGPDGVMGEDDILLDGADDGLPGSNYVTSLTWRELVLTPAEARKLAHLSEQWARPAGALAHRFIGKPKSHRLKRHSTT